MTTVPLVPACQLRAVRHCSGPVCGLVRSVVVGSMVCYAVNVLGCGLLDAGVPSLVVGTYELEQGCGLLVAGCQCAKPRGRYL